MSIRMNNKFSTLLFRAYFRLLFITFYPVSLEYFTLLYAIRLKHIILFKLFFQRVLIIPSHRHLLLLIKPTTYRLSVVFGAQPGLIRLLLDTVDYVC